MGNYRFKLSDMIPNAWFYKLKHMSTKHSEEHHHHHPKPTKKSNAKNATSSSSISSLQSSVPSHNHIITTRQQPHLSEQRKSYYFTRDFTNNLSPNSPTKPEKKSFNVVENPRRSSSSSRRRRRSTKRNIRHNSPRLVSSSISAGCSCRATFESVWTKMDDSITTPIHRSSSSYSSSSDRDSVLPEYGSGRDDSPSWSTSCNCSARNDSFISDDEDEDTKESNISDASELIHQIPPIITKKKPEPTKTLRTSSELVEEKTRRRLSVKIVKEETTTTTWSSNTTAKNNHHKNIITSTSPVRLRLSSASSQSGVRLRTNSPRMKIQGRKSVSSTRRSGVSESFAVVKASMDPKKDFRKSMVEMIVENDIRKSKDLEELLACYLSLNSDEYHDLIINVFKQIWFDFVRVRLK